MFKSYFRSAWRNLVKNKVYSALNILGLATGMAVALLIGLWVHYQYSYDRFLPGYQQAYQVRYRFTTNGEKVNIPSTVLPLGEALKKISPGSNMWCKRTGWDSMAWWQVIKNYLSRGPSQGVI